MLLFHWDFKDLKIALSHFKLVVWASLKEQISIFKISLSVKIKVIINIKAIFKIETLFHLEVISKVPNNIKTIILFNSQNKLHRISIFRNKIRTFNKVIIFKINLNRHN